MPWREAEEGAWPGYAPAASRTYHESATSYGGPTGIPIREEILSETSRAACNGDPERLWGPLPSMSATCCSPTLISASRRTLAQLRDLVDPPAPARRLPALVAGLDPPGAGAPSAVMLLLVAVQLAVLAAGIVQIRSRPTLERCSLRRLTRWVARTTRTGVGSKSTAHRLGCVCWQRMASCMRAAQKASSSSRPSESDRRCVRMCQLQDCFTCTSEARNPGGVGCRADLSQARWPQDDEALRRRAQFVEAYTAACAGHAACQHLMTMGAGREHPLCATACAPSMMLSRVHESRCRWPSSASAYRNRDRLRWMKSSEIFTGTDGAHYQCPLPCPIPLKWASTSTKRRGPVSTRSIIFVLPHFAAGHPSLQPRRENLSRSTLPMMMVAWWPMGSSFTRP